MLSKKGNERLTLSRKKVKVMSLMVLLKLLGSLALLMFGMKAMSESLQKMAGPQLRHVLGAMTTNRFSGMLTGMFVTAAVQSSTATTLMTVSFVNAGMLTLVQAISVIMGAHIGTTITAWIMALDFGFNIGNYVWIAFFIGIILIYMKRHRVGGDFLFGIAFLFLGLTTLRETSFELVTSDANGVIQAFFARFNDLTIWNSLLFLLIGTVLTLCVQSSAAIMAMTMTLCATGIIPIEQGVMLVLGENVGTTITSNIAAMSANTQARRAAFAHLSINVIGVVWVMLLLKPFFGAVCSIVGFDVAMPYSDSAYPLKVSVVLAAFHTAFNLLNTLLLIGFVPQIEQFVCRVIAPTKVDEDEEDSKLQFITGGMLETPELSLLAAQKEISAFGRRMAKMFGICKALLELKNEDFAKQYTRIQKYEAISDNMEIEIAKYLDEVSEAHLSPESKDKTRSMLRQISELESIGDSCFNIARTINRKLAGNEHFTDSQKQHMHQMFTLVDASIEQMNRLLSGRKSQFDINRSYNIEHEINNYRNQLRSQNILDIDKHQYNYAIGTMYMDVISECEKIGDYIVNVVQARMGKK